MIPMGTRRMTILGQRMNWVSHGWIMRYCGWTYRFERDGRAWENSWAVVVQRWINVNGNWRPDGWEKIADGQTIRSGIRDVIIPRHAMKMAPAPGKFEGEPSYAEYYWGAALDGAGDDVISASGRTVSFFKVNRGDRILFPYIANGTRWVSLWEDDQGFVWSEELTARGKERVVEDLEAEAADAAEEEE